MLEEISRREQAGLKIVHLVIGRPDFETPCKKLPIQWLRPSAV